MLTSIVKGSVTYKKYNSYLELKSYVKIPNIQRNLTLSRVDLMREHIRSNAVKFKEPIFGTLDLVCIEGIEKLYICDGQHRFTALQQEFEENKVFVPIHCLIYKVSTYEEMEEIFITRNLGVPVPDYYLELKNELNTKNGVMKEIEEYLSIIPTFVYTSTRRPTVNITNFINAFTKSKLFPLIRKIEDFRKVLEIINLEAANIVENMTPHQIKKNAISQKMLDTWRESSIYIGYDHNFKYFSETADITRFEEILH